MRYSLTKRRLLGFAVGAAGLVLLATGALQSRPSLSIMGLAAWCLLLFGLMVALLQRVIVVMQLAAGTRSDAERALGLTEATIPSIRKLLAEQSGAQRAELAQTAQSLRSDSQALQASIQNELTVHAGTRNAMAAAQTFALEKALADVRGVNERIRLEVRRLRSDQKSLRESLMDAHAAALRGQRIMKAEITREIEATLQLRQLLQVDAPMPLLGGWALDAEAMLALVRLVLDEKPARIVELGSGTSTIWLALALRHLGRGTLLSFDHLEEFSQRTAAALREHGLQAQAQVRTAPLVPIEIDGTSYEWYDLADEALAPIDILIVDGPPASVGAMARYPAIPLLRKALRPGAAIVVDDASRVDEKKMTLQWFEDLPGLEEGAELGPRTRVLRVVAEQAALPLPARDVGQPELNAPPQGLPTQ